MKALPALIFAVLLAVLMPAAAWAQQAGKPDSSTERAVAVSACVGEPEEIGLDAMTSLGVSGAKILEEVGGEFAATLDWRKGALYATFGLAGGQTQLVVELNHDGNAVTFINSTGGGCPPNDLMGAPCVVCEPRMEIGVIMTLTTEDGALVGESLPGTLTTRGKGGRLNVEAPVSTVVGTYLQEVQAHRGRKPTAIVLEASWGGPVPGAKGHNASGWNGFVAMRLEGNAGSPVMVAHGYWIGE